MHTGLEAIWVQTCLERYSTCVEILMCTKKPFQHLAVPTSKKVEIFEEHHDGMVAEYFEYKNLRTVRSRFFLVYLKDDGQ